MPAGLPLCGALRAVGHRLRRAGGGQQERGADQGGPRRPAGLPAFVATSKEGGDVQQRGRRAAGPGHRRLGKRSLARSVKPFHAI
jgi:hypothetical protein